MYIPAQYKQLIGVWQGYSIFVVDGEYIRTTLKVIQFDDAGNGQAYIGFIPANEIWAELKKPNDLIANICHEYFESEYMKSTGASYDEAHGLAMQFEGKVRAILGLSDANS